MALFGSGTAKEETRQFSDGLGSMSGILVHTCMFLVHTRQNGYVDFYRVFLHMKPIKGLKLYKRYYSYVLFRAFLLGVFGLCWALNVHTCTYLVHTRQNGCVDFFIVQYRHLKQHTLKKRSKSVVNLKSFFF